MRYLLFISAILMLTACSHHRSETKSISGKPSSAAATAISTNSTRHQIQLVDTTLHFDDIAGLIKYNNYIYARLDSFKLHNTELSDFEKEKIYYDNSILLEKLKHKYFATCDKDNYKNFNFLRLVLYRTSDSSKRRKMWQLFNSFPEKYRNSTLGKKDQALLLNSPHNVNRSLSPAARFLFESEEGKHLPMDSLIDHKHQYYILLFTASWCAPCRYYADFFKDTLQKVNGQGIKVISISIDKSRGQWLQYLKEANYHWYNYRALDGWDSKITKYLNLKAIPNYLLVNKEGNIMEQETGYGMNDIIQKINASVGG